MKISINRAFALLGTLLAGSLLLAGAADAQTIMPGPTGSSSVWTVYGFGNAQAISDTFRGVANFCASATFKGLVLLISLIGVLSVGASSGFSGAMARKFIGYIVSVFLITYIFFGVKAEGPLSVQVEVIDAVDATWRAPVTVPAVVGIPAAMISTAGHEIMRQIEASFPIPDELKLSNGAPFNLSAAMLNDASKAKITNPALASSMAMYVQDCFIPAVATGDKNVQTLITSTNFLADLQVSNQALLVNSYLPKDAANTMELMTCGEAYTQITTTINKNSADGAAGYLNNASAWSRTPALNVVNAGADAVARHATNNGVTDGASLVKQAAVLSSFTGAFSQAAAQTGNSDFLTGLAVTQAQTNQINGWITGAEVFNKTMGYIFAVLQVFVYAITPLILAAALIPGVGGALLKNFVQILLWLAIWQPMLAIVNFIILSLQQSDLGGALTSGAGSFGFTLENMNVVSERTTNLRAAATFIGTMVPALAWAMVKGSVDFSRVISGAVGESAAAGAANTLTTGNYSLNSGSMDSFTSNKHSLGSTFDSGGISTTPQGGINEKIDKGGVAVTQDGRAASVTPGYNLNAGKGGVAANGASNSQGGSDNLNDSRTLSHQTGTDNRRSGGHTSNSAIAEQQALSFVLGASLGASLGAGGGAGGGKGGAAAGAGAGGAADEKAQQAALAGLFKKLGMNIPIPKLSAGANLNGSTSAGSTATQTEADMFSRVLSAFTGAGSQNAAARQYGAQDGAQVTGRAEDTKNWGQQDSLTVNGFASDQDRLSLVRAAGRGRFTPIASAGLNTHPDTNQDLGRVGNKVRDQAEPNYIDKHVDPVKAEVQKDKDAYTAQAEQFRQKAHDKAGETSSTSQRLAGQQERATDATEKNSKKPAGQLLNETDAQGRDIQGKAGDALKGVLGNGGRVIGVLDTPKDVERDAAAASAARATPPASTESAPAVGNPMGDPMPSMSAAVAPPVAAKPEGAPVTAAQPSNPKGEQPKGANGQGKGVKADKSEQPEGASVRRQTAAEINAPLPKLQTPEHRPEQPRNSEAPQQQQLVAQQLQQPQVPPEPAKETPPPSLHAAPGTMGAHGVVAAMGPEQHGSRQESDEETPANRAATQAAQGSGLLMQGTSPAPAAAPAAAPAPARSTGNSNGGQGSGAGNDGQGGSGKGNMPEQTTGTTSPPQH